MQVGLRSVFRCEVEGKDEEYLSGVGGFLYLLVLGVFKLNRQSFDVIPALVSV